MNELQHAAQQLREARQSTQNAFNRAKSAALVALANGAAEATVARELGVDRMTVRKWAGKR